MRIAHWVRRENSGLFHSAMEWIEEEERQGHQVSVREPSTNNIIYGFADKPDIHIIHSQLHPSTYHDGIPKVMVMHGEPLGSVSNGISMRAIVDLAPLCDAFICMRQEEWPVWNAIRRTYVVKKGIDLNRFKLQETKEKLSGNPAVLYYENWRGQRNPLLLCAAMQEVAKVLPDAKLHLYNCPGGKLYDTFHQLIHHCRWYTFVGSLKGQEKDVVGLLNRADIVASCLYPLYARSIEALACGKALICPGYREDKYPYHCDLEVNSIAGAIINAAKEQGIFDFRQWAEDNHDVSLTVKECISVYQRYI